MRANLKSFSIIFIATWLVSLVFHLYQESFIYEFIASSIILFFGYWYGYKKPTDHEILASTQIYYFLPLVIPLSLGFHDNSTIKIIWVVYILTSLIICLSKLERINKKNYLSITKSILISALLAKLIYFEVPSHSIMLFTVFAFNALVMVNYKKVNFKPAIILLAVMAASYFAINFTDHFYYKNEIVAALYTIGMTYYCYRNEHEGASYLFGLFMLLIISLLDIGSIAYNLSLVQFSLLCSTTMLFLIKSPVIYRKKSKYGMLAVVNSKYRNAHILYNDNVIHGVQNINSNNNAYYSPSSPLGKVLSKLTKEDNSLEMAVIGLGIGSLSTYGKNKNHHISFYEIDEEVIKIAKNPELFTILRDSKADIKIIKGDARKTLENAEDESYDIIICDGYFGFSISSSLVTFEALKLYYKKLKQDGILFIHTTGSEVEKTILERNMLALKLVGYTNTHNPNATTKKIHQGLYNFTKKNKFEENIDHYIKALLQATGLYLHNLNHLSTEWKILAKDEQYLNNLSLETSWIKIKRKNQLNGELLTDADLAPIPKK